MNTFQTFTTDSRTPVVSGKHVTHWCAACEQLQEQNNRLAAALSKALTLRAGPECLREIFNDKA